MAKDLTLKNTLEVVQANALIEASYSLSSLQAKIIQFILGGISPRDSDLCAYRFHIADLRSALRLKGRSLTKKIVNGHLEALRQARIEIKGETSTIHCGWISSYVHFSGTEKVEVFIDPKLKPFLIGLKEQYTRALREMIFRFSAHHEARLYLLLKQYETIGRRRIEVKDLRYMLDIKEHEYRRFNDFKRRIIAKSLLTMNKETDLAVEMEEERVGRKVVALIFKMKSQPYRELLPFSFDDDRIEKHEDQYSDIVKRLCRLGVQPEDAHKSVSKDPYFEEETVIAVEKYLENLEKNGEPIKTSPLRIYQTAKRDKWGVKTDWERQQEGRKKEAIAEARKAKATVIEERTRSDLRFDFDKARRDAAFEIYKKKPKEEQETIKATIQTRLTGIVRKTFIKSGFRGIAGKFELVKMFASDLPETLQDFDQWIDKNEVK